MLIVCWHFWNFYSPPNGFCIFKSFKWSVTSLLLNSKMEIFITCKRSLILQRWQTHPLPAPRAPTLHSWDSERVEGQELPARTGARNVHQPHRDFPQNEIQLQVYFVKTTVKNKQSTSFYFLRENFMCKSGGTLWCHFHRVALSEHSCTLRFDTA